MKVTYTIILSAIAFLVFGAIGNFDYEDEQHQRDEYCEMVTLWKADAARGVPEHDRAGWPPFDGECNE